ncbi:unannotated protein [freshwater metagenome]|uniref:Unannotated protein n=1 Tax=freshwater metagenome TaxID=449393 RepID=A0A6J6F2G3_9ZZZZ
MDGHDGVPVFNRHVPDGCVAHDARVVHDDVESTEGVDGLLDHVATCFVIGDVAVVRHRDSAASFNQGHGFVGRAACAFTRNAATEVVHNNLGAVLREFHGVTTANAVSRASDDGDLAVEHAH